ncbi:cytochrome c oxidase assembly factor 1 homolog [Megalops cyprinoides]|uniref:cytochrome c oxidase assembly factor 1 homolog n=1 Tax=Megalops cyprinoides TaxID=118141 RepID=UPI0018642B53|nr:cytochrome c oxidase assembly factor 1 homolog [Megalops cyprinoides]
MPASIQSLQQMAIFVTVVTGGGCSMMYYLMQKNFARSEHYRSALEHLSGHSGAMESLGAPPLKVHNIHLTDRYNRMDQSSAQLKIPVTGSKTGGYLYTSSNKDHLINRWCLQEVILQLKDGQRIDILRSGTKAPDHPEELDTGAGF